MLEVELKARIDDGYALIEALKREGFVFRREVIETDTYYNGANRDFSKTDEALRLRTVECGGEREYRITYKGKKHGGAAKTREEYETGIGDIDCADALLKALGHSPVRTVKKRRAYYEKGDITVCVDDVEGLGLFVELECMGGSPDGLLKLKDRLNIGVCTDKSYLEMLLSEINANGHVH